MEQIKTSKFALVAVMLSFFTMGMVDLVGVATSLIKEDFNLDSFTSSFIPMMVFVWFAVFSIPAAVLMDRIGRKNTVLLSVVITAVSLILPFVWYNFYFILFSFALVGIANTFLQVSLNPLVSNIVSDSKLASTLTFGQFVKALASFSGPLLASLYASKHGDWKIVLVTFSLSSLVCTLLLYMVRVDETLNQKAQVRVTFSSTLTQLKDAFVLRSFVGIVVIVGIDVGVNTNIAQLLSDRMNISVQAGAVGISIYFAAKTLGAFLGTFLLLKFNPNQFLRWSMLITFLGFALLIFVYQPALLYLGIGLIGFFCANVFSIIFTAVLQHNKERVNELSSLMIMGVAGGAIITPIAGYASSVFGLGAAFFTLLLCAVYLFLLSVFLNKTTKI